MNAKKARVILRCRTVSESNPEGNKQLAGRILASMKRVGGILPALRDDLELAGEYFDTILGGSDGAVFTLPNPELHDEYVESQSKEIRFRRWDLAKIKCDLIAQVESRGRF